MASRWPSQEEVDAYVAARAPSFGIQPAIAVAVRRGESRSGFIGDNGSSFGPFQLHIGGIAGGANAGKGLGDAFIADTGLNPRDPSTWQAQVDYALGHVAKNGWGAFHAAAAIGIGLWDGIGGALNPGDISSGIREGIAASLGGAYGGLIQFTHDRAASIVLLMAGIVLVIFGIWSFAMQNDTVRETVSAASNVAGVAAAVL